MQKPDNNLKEKKKLRSTRQRLVLMEVLSSVYSHPTAIELFEMVKEKLPGISLSTVYRNLDRLVDEGMVLRLDTGKGPARFDGHTHQHYHIRCIECGRVDDISLDVDTSLQGRVAEVSGYEVLGQTTEFYGLCPVCRNKARH